MSRIALDMAEVASLIGDASRAHILSALMDGGAWTALELSLAAGVTPQTTSSHLAKLQSGNLLTVSKQGRHRYYRLASAQVAQTLEAVMSLVASAPPNPRAQYGLDAELGEARICYDHIAGRIGVGICDALINQGYIVFEDDVGEVTERGHRFFAELGLDLIAPAKSRRIFCRPCLDWSERRQHIAGRVGAAIAHFCLEKNWLARRTASRVLTVTSSGSTMLSRAFGIEAQRLV